MVIEENPPKKISVCFGFDSALKTIDTQMFFWSVFLKTRQKVIDHQKRHFGPFWQLIMFFCVFSKILFKITSVRLLFLKLKQKKNVKKNFLYSFYFKTQKCSFWGSPNFFQIFFLSVLAFKTIDIQTSMPNLVKKY